MYRTLQAPIEVQWEVTGLCNHRCVHCYNFWRTDPQRAAPARDTLNLYRTVVDEVVEHKVFKVTVTGGEPLIVFDDIYPFLEALRAAGVWVHVNSNLTLLTAEKAAALQKLDIPLMASLVSAVPATHDAITQVTGSFRRVVRGLETALASGMTPVVNMVVTRRNHREVLTTARLVAGMGIKVFAATKACKPVNCADFGDYALSLDEFRAMLRQLLEARDELGLRVGSFIGYPTCAFDDEPTRTAFRARVCAAGRTNCTVGFDGIVHPCSHASMGYGHIDDGLEKAWLAMQDWRSHAYTPEACGHCNARNLCMGGCRIEAYTHHGSLGADDPYADYDQTPIPMPRTIRVIREGQVEINATNVIDNPNLQISPRLKHRPEDFGGIFIFSKFDYVPVDHALYAFICAKGERAMTSVAEIAGALGIPPDEAAETVIYLLSKSILRIKRTQPREPGAGRAHPARPDRALG